MKVFLIFCTAILCTSFYNSGTIIWTSDTKLTWNNFKADVPPNEDFIDALSCTGIYYYSQCKNDTLSYTVVGFFSENQSWVKDIAKTDHILEHEQIHFDITGLCSVQIQNYINLQKIDCQNKMIGDSLINVQLKKWVQFQNQYDFETKHSRDSLFQKNWKEFLNNRVVLENH